MADRVALRMLIRPLKINDELVDVKGKPGGIDFVDWPFIDESAYKAAAELADKNMHEKDA